MLGQQQKHVSLDFWDQPSKSRIRSLQPLTTRPRSLEERTIAFPGAGTTWVEGPLEESVPWGASDMWAASPTGLGRHLLLHCPSAPLPSWGELLTGAGLKDTGQCKGVPGLGPGRCGPCLPLWRWASHGGSNSQAQEPLGFWCLALISSRFLFCFQKTPGPGAYTSSAQFPRQPRTIAKMGREHSLFFNNTVGF